MQCSNAHSYMKDTEITLEGGINATFNAVRLRVAIIEFTP